MHARIVVWAVLISAIWADGAFVAAADVANGIAEIPIYPGAAPGSENWDWKERIVKTESGMPIVRDVVRPVLMHYPAEKSKAVGTAMIVAPGGGWKALMMSYEGEDVAKTLNAMGVDAFVLKYRLLYTGPGAPNVEVKRPTEHSKPYILTGEFKAQAAQDVVALAVADGRQAIRVLRERASEFGVRPDRIGMIGYSAGGVVTTEAIFGPTESRPNFAAIIYGVGAFKEMPEPAPPLFLAVSADDPIAVDRSIDLFTFYNKAKGPAELHVFQMGAHGFVNKGGGADHYLDRLKEWLATNKLLTKPIE